MTRQPIERFSKSLDMRKLNRTTAWRLSAAGRRSKDALSLSKSVRIVACPICQSPEYQLLSEIYGFKYVSCFECSHVYVRNMPIETALRAFYENQMQDVQMRPSEDFVDLALYETRVREIASPKVNYITEIVGKPGRWVDIGCGTGEMLYAAREFGWDTVGYEIDPEEIRVARDVFKLNIVEGLLDSSNAKSSLPHSKVISLMSVLEHVPNPLDILMLIKKFAAEDVCLVLELPHHPSLSALCNVHFPYLVARHMLPPNHLHLFTNKSMEHMLKRAGFEPTNIWYYGQDVYELLGTVAAASKLGESPLMEEMLNITTDMQQVLDRARMCDEFMIVGKRSDRSLYG